jgi:hypothetical protein
MVEGVMDVYTVTKVALTIDGHGFSILGMHRRPVVHFGYEHEREAIAAVEHVRQAIIKAKLIVEIWPDAASAESAFRSGLVTWENDQHPPDAPVVY